MTERLLPSKRAWLEREGLTLLPEVVTPETATAAIESARFEMIVQGVRPHIARAWASKARARATVARLQEAEDIRRRDAFFKSLVYKTHDPHEKLELRRQRHREAVARARQVLSR